MDKRATFAEAWARQGLYIACLLELTERRDHAIILLDARGDTVFPAPVRKEQANTV